MEDNIKHLYYMDLALEQAKIALDNREVPIGAVVVDVNGEILGFGSNKTEENICQVSHAEVIAISGACKKKGDWRLEGCCIYVTLEPCLMCFGLIGLSRMKGVFYGAKSPLFGVGLDNEITFPVYKKDLFIRGGLRAEESVCLLQEFFKGRRKKG